MRTWLVSDTHFGHHNMYKFTNRDTGERVRPWAQDAHEGDAIMIEKWNERVAPNDRVYHLGDVAIPRKALAKMNQLNGRKVLIKGNHDIFKMKDYAEHFDDIRGTHKLGEFILSHYPLHTDSVAHWCTANLHGHTHSEKMKLADGSLDTRYLNMCVEWWDAGPVDFAEIMAMFE